MNCELHKGDPFCDDGYKSSFQIEEMDRDGNRSCIHLTDNDTSKAFDGY